MSKRVLIASNLFPPFVVGGAEIVAERQARALAERGNDVTVFAGCFRGKDQEPGSLTRDDHGGIPVYRTVLPSLDPDGNFFRPEFGRRLTAIMAAHRPEVVHFHNVAGLGINLLPVAKAFGAKVVVTLHDHWGICFKNTLLRNDQRLCPDTEDCAVCRPRIQAFDNVTIPMRLRRDYVAWCLSHADMLVSPSSYLARAYNTSQALTRPVRVLSNGINLNVVQTKPDKFRTPIQFACFSYLGQHKGILQLLEAAERLASIPDLRGRWKLTIAGHGDLAPKLEAGISSGRFGDSVTYLGRLTHQEALKVLAQTHVVVLPSVWPENEPVTMLEAIASGTAQIASRIGGNIELVEEEKSGLFFTPGDSTSLLAAMERFVRDPDLAQRFGHYNAARRSSFAEEATIEKMLAFYDESPEPSLREEVIVICVGRPPAQELDLMMHHFHKIEQPGRRVRFIWNRWADALVWRRAHLVWFWGSIGDTDIALASQALRYGAPILAQEDTPLASLAESSGNLGAYTNMLDALGLIAALADAPDLKEELAIDNSSASRLLGAVARRSTFYLPTRSIP